MIELLPSFVLTVELSSVSSCRAVECRVSWVVCTVPVLMSYRIAYAKANANFVPGDLCKPPIGDTARVLREYQYATET